MARSWGWWTEQKLDILSSYLAAFTQACKRAGSTVYLDLFAGQAENVSRERSAHEIRGSARRALDTNPPFSVLRFFELASNAATLEQTLAKEYPKRNFRVVPGDCNDTIEQVLAELKPMNWAPTFTFLDQQSTEVRWPTLRRLAEHKKAGSTKVELWLLCASGLLPRGLRVRQDVVDSQVSDQMTAMFGTDQWLPALDATRTGQLTPTAFRGELTNLMRWRLEKGLGYRETHVFKVTNTVGSEIFDMIFATDHAVGSKIMKYVYSQELKRQAALREKARHERSLTRQEALGQFSLFNAGDIEAPQVVPTGYDVEPVEVPTRPPFGVRNF